MQFIKKITPYIGLSLILIILDQITKYWASIQLKAKPPIVWIPGVFELNYLENKGAAFGIFQNQRIFFVILTIILSIFMLHILYKLPETKRYTPFKLCLIFILSGGLGNLIDRIVNGYVIDFFYFSLINFPVFNVADCYVTISMIVLIYLVIFYYKDNELKLF